MTIWRISTACGKTKAISAHTLRIRNTYCFYTNGYANAPKCYVTQTLSVLSAMDGIWSNNLG